MWQAVKLSTGRWFVIRNGAGADAGKREFLKLGPGAQAFKTEKAAEAEAEKLNLANNAAAQLRLG
jgi:hypothetical protein